MKIEETINGNTYVRNTSVLKAIRQKCVEDCCAGYVSEANNCLSTSCPLYPFRMGKNPYRKQKPISEEHKQHLLDNIRKAREAKKL